MYSNKYMHTNTNKPNQTKAVWEIKHSISSNAPAIMRQEEICVHTFILRKINILIWRKYYYKIWLAGSVLGWF
jgi:hypothetical protein